MAEPALEARGVRKDFGPRGDVHALCGVDVRVWIGETVCLIGGSGSGKTTLLRHFNALERASAGEVLVGGRDITTLDPIELRRHTGYVQQEGGLLPHWSVARNVGLVPELLGWSSERRRKRTDELLALVSLPPAQYRERFPRELSGGERQRVAFARALAADPPVVLLDEPFGALDPITRRELAREFESLQDELEKTMLLVTHDLTEALRFGDRVLVLRAGRVEQCATPDELRRDPVPYVRELLEAAGL